MEWVCTTTETGQSCATMVAEDDDPIYWISQQSDILAGFAVLVVIALGFLVGYAISSRR